MNSILRGLNTSLMVVETCYIRFATLNYIKRAFIRFKSVMHCKTNESMKLPTNVTSKIRERSQVSRKTSLAYFIDGYLT